MMLQLRDIVMSNLPQRRRRLALIEHPKRTVIPSQLNSTHLNLSLLLWEIFYN